MPSRDSIVRDLLEKLRDAPAQELSEVVDFAEFLRTRRKLAPAELSAQAAQATQAAMDALEAREQRAAAAGLLRLPEPNARKLSTVDAPPLLVSGRAASDIVLEDRR